MNVAAPTSAELRGIERVLHSEPKALQHKPCRLLRDTKRAMNLHAGHAVLAIAEHPESGHPLIESKGRILEHGSNLERELLVASTAEPKTPSLAFLRFRLDGIVLFRTATWARDVPIRPTELAGILKTAVRIGEENDSLLQSFRRFHSLNIRRLFSCVRYIFASFCTYISQKGVHERYASFDPRILCPNYARLWCENRKTAPCESGFRNPIAQNQRDANASHVRNWQDSDPKSGASANSATLARCC
jgi:hypothetical protein